jgi:hypothetical protein
MANYIIVFCIDEMEFTTDVIKSETEMLQKKEKLLSVADRDSVKVKEHIV